MDEEFLLKLLEDHKLFAEHDMKKRGQIYYDVTANYNYKFANDPSKQRNKEQVLGDPNPP